MASGASRLPSGLEVAGLLRLVETAGGFAVVVRKGDPERGALVLLIASRGRHFACLERILLLDGGYQWRATGPGESAGSAEISQFLEKRARFDEDFWAIELDIADPQRFVAEMGLTG